MKKILIIVLIVNCGLSSKAQEVPDILVSSGDEFKDKQGSMSWSIGSLYDYIDISGIYASNNYSGPGDIKDDQNIYRVYPTITKTYVTIEIPEQQNFSKTVLKIYDPTGSILKVIQLTDPKTEMDLSGYAKGSLFFTFFDESENLIETQTIIKSK